MQSSSIPAGYEISAEARWLDADMIHKFLSEESYWSVGIPRSVVDRAIENSLCFGVYKGTLQVGFARVITDKATFALLADVFILNEHRGKGLSKHLMRYVVEHKDLQGLRRLLLLTSDAHSLYQQFGFGPIGSPSRFMEILRPEVYRSS